MSENREEMTFEAALARMEEIVRMLEKGEASLEDSLKLFEEGTALARLCEKKLSEAEQRVTVLVGETEVPFQTAEESRK